MPQWPVPPTLSYCEMAVDCLATMHAKLWDHPQLGLFGELPPPRITEAEMRERLSESFASVDPFLDFLQDRISVQRNQLFRRVIHALPSLWVNRNARRPTGQPGYSLGHGDAHFWNFMYPKNPRTAPAYLIDWQSYEVSVPLIDLAYMIALHWYPERRARLERPLVRRYHDRLLAEGVEDYPWEECWEDYRRATLTMFLTPMFFWAADLHAAIWWPHLERICLAYDDLACGELLE